MQLKQTDQKVVRGQSRSVNLDQKNDLERLIFGQKKYKMNVLYGTRFKELIN